MHKLSNFLLADLKPTSAGLAIISNHKCLLVKSTYSARYWGYPKGMVEDAENKFDAAKREVEEETGIILNNYQYEVKETIEYSTPNKNCTIFIIIIEQDITDLPLKCDSCFDDYGTSTPEVDDYRWVTYAELDYFIGTDYSALKKYMVEDQL